MPSSAGSATVNGVRDHRPWGPGATPLAFLSPATTLGQALLTGLFDAVPAAGSRFAAWQRLFGQAVGIRRDRLRSSLELQGAAHGRDYAGHVPETLFALHSALALTAKLVAASVLPGIGTTLTGTTGEAMARLRWVDSGAPFAAAGIAGMTSPDLFDWIALGPAAARLAPVVAGVMIAVADAVAATGLGHPDAPWAGDLFTGVYQALVPRELRHALGEVYTPPGLAAHALDVLGWQSPDPLLDPTCGSGVFLLEALRRRLAAESGAAPAAALLDGLFGIDLNPLAVQAAKASLVVALAGRFQPSRPVRLPVYLACALTLPRPVGDWPEAAADAAAAAAIPRVSHLAGNPPWVRWSQLPPAYAAAIKPVATGLGLLDGDHYVGGIEADLAAAVTLAAPARWLRPGGRMAFYLTASLFSTPSGRGFRRFIVPEPVGACRVLMVEDLKALAPFEGVSNHPALLLLEAGGATRYPVPYRVRLPAVPKGAAGGDARDGAGFQAATRVQELLARPLPGAPDDGPWLKGSVGQQALWQHLFDAAAPAGYRARKGVTTDRNGIYFVRVAVGPAPGLVEIANQPELGRTAAVPRVAAVVEDEHLFPLLRGRGLSPFRAVVEPELRVMVPQRGMHGDPALPDRCPRTFGWFKGFEAELGRRASYRRYQSGQPFWSIWSTGPYTFAPWKVLWREISSRFCAAYLGPVLDDVLGPRVVVPDHKLYFVPVSGEDEAAYLAGLLNAPAVAEAVSACGAALSLGAGVIETLKIPPFAADDARHQALATLAATITHAGRAPGAAEAADLDRLALGIIAGSGLG